MKAHHGLLPMILLFITTGCLTGEAQKTDVKRLVDSQTYTFIAQRANPMSSASIDLAGGYDVVVSKNKIVVYLPYYGRAYTAPSTSDGGIKFTSTSFEHTLTPGKKDSWNITIKPKDDNTIRELLFIFFDNGTATLQVNSDQRQPISFDGYIRESKPAKESKN